MEGRRGGGGGGGNLPGGYKKVEIAPSVMRNATDEYCPNYVHQVWREDKERKEKKRREKETRRRKNSWQNHE